MFVLDKRNDANYALPIKELQIKNFKVLSSSLAQKIIKQIALKPSYAKELSKKLKEHEQKIYYHIRNIEKAGFIRLMRTETIQGAVANIYTITDDAFMFKLKDFKQSQKIASKEEANEYLNPFIKKGQLNCLIVVGSPDPHGPDKVRSRDGYYGMDLALFLGTHLNYVPQLNVKLDTEMRQEDLENNNLIVIGGSITNKVMAKLNDKLPIRFENGNIKSIISNIIYPNAEHAFIVKSVNPFNKDKRILTIAGKGFAGTRGAIIAFLKHFNDIVIGNKFNNKIDARVIEGLDIDSDGVVDEVEFLE